MNETERAWFALSLAVWQAGVVIWAERWVDMAALAFPAPDTSHARALKRRASFRVVG